MEFHRGNKEMERPGNIVLDASVVVKLFVDEEYTDLSLQLLEDYLNGKVTLYSVQLMPYEVINALRYNRLQMRDASKYI